MHYIDLIWNVNILLQDRMAITQTHIKRGKEGCLRADLTSTLDDGKQY